jgi:twitching motility protein PilT
MMMSAFGTLTPTHDKQLLVEDLLQDVIRLGASDLHLSVGLPPVLRVDGHLTKLPMPPFERETCQKLLFNMLTNEQRRILEQTLELDFAYSLKDLGRFRVNIYKERNNYAAAIRAIKSKAPTLKNLGLPSIVQELCYKTKGLILVTGPTGSGKSTTLAAMIDHINTQKADHILTIEDPIEFVHHSKKSIVHQRELGVDTQSFANALKSSLREDPDVILIGEMRDLETISLAMTAAETGHLVMGTLHTSSAAQTIDRIVDVFPHEQQQQIRVQLSSSLLTVMSQVLLPRLNELGEVQGRVLCQEIMVNNSAIANLIREGKTPQMYSCIQTGASLGMTTMENSLYHLIQNRLIRREDALIKSTRPEELRRLLGER